MLLQVELKKKTSGFEEFRKNSIIQTNDLKDSVLHWQTEVRIFILYYS